MKTWLFIWISIFIVSCGNDEDGVNEPGTKLLSIDIYTTGLHKMENYIYDADTVQPRLIQMIADYRRYEMEYDGDRLFQISTFDRYNGQAIFKDSITYNDAGRIDRIFVFSVHQGQDLAISWWYEYKYDTLFQLTERNEFNIDLNKYNWYEKYFWKDNNIEKVDNYDENLHLRSSYFYLYDKQHNYKKNHPVWIDDPVYWSDNNVTLMWFNDYFGNIDPYCNPCQYSYYYNRDGYPYKINTNWDYRVDLQYE